MESSNDNRQSLLKDEKQKISDIMQISTVLLDNGNRHNFVSGVAPSVYMQEMSMTTEERCACLMKQERSNEVIPGQPSVGFRATPNIVIFQQFTPGNTYSVTLSVKNITSSSQHLKLIGTKNSWFTLTCTDSMCKTKLAPGMSIVYDVKFSPEERRDYKYHAAFAMGSETFTVHILAIGPRPLLDFPDFVEVPQTAVKILSQKHLLVRNIGHVPAVFSLATIRPFTVHPQKGVLAEGETMQVTVNFLSAKQGCFREDLIVTYETGEVINLNLSGCAENCVIRLERGSIRMEETYLGLTRSRTFVIHNRSNYVSNFRWVMYPNSRRDELEQEMYKRSFEMIKNIEIARRVDLEHYNICVPLLHELACQRVYTDELCCLTEHSFPFRHPDYRLTPLEGQIWPHSTVAVTLIFEPDEVGGIEGRAYLEITGCEERIPLDLHGTCIGPLIKLNVTSVDLGSIFLCSNHNYEVICGNKGDIPGTLVHTPRPADFFGKVNVTPIQVKLQPGKCKSFNICFSSNRTGEFTERVDFIVKESLEVISFFIKGSVICPTLHFDRQNLEFGLTALGFTSKHDVCLHNTSPVPVTFRLTITQDGTHEALTHEDFARCGTKPSLSGNPKEFAVTPTEGVVAPRSFQRIKISYTPNVARSNQTALRADMWDSDSEPVTLPIMFSSKVASLVVRPSEIFIRFCFINFPYMRSITVENKSDVEGYFYLPPQSVTISPTVMYSLSLHQGYLKPNESKSIALKILTTALGRQKVQLSLLAFGDRNIVPCCSLICNGQGPIVTVQPTQLNWGEVRLLEAVTSTITLVNDSPVPAQFAAGLRKSPSLWTVSPASGALEPNKSLELEITVHLRDTGEFSDIVDIEIMSGRVITCSLTAVGIGTSIILTPNMIPVFDMGLLFRDQDISIPITMVNEGTKHMRLTWTTVADPPLTQISGANERQQDVFTIDPYHTELPPGAESVIHCKIRWAAELGIISAQPDIRKYGNTYRTSTRNDSLTEQWYLHAQIKGEGKRQVLGSSLFSATFTNPNIFFSKRKMTFRYDSDAYETKTHLMDTLLVINQSGLELRARINIDPPFELIAEKENGAFPKITTMLLPNHVSTRICIRFNVQAIDLSNLYSKIFRRSLTFDYETHRAKDEIECIAEVNYPNISISPMEPVILSCEVGSTVRKNLTLMNTGPLSVRYHFEWLVVNGVRIPTTAHDTPCLQSQDSLTIHGNEGDEEEEMQAGDDEEGDGEGEECQSVRSPPEISFTRELDRSKISVPEALHVIRDPSNNPSALVQVVASDIQDFIFPMMKRYFFEDTEIPALADPQTRATDEREPGTSLITEILDVVPKEGIVLPHSSQCVYFELDALQRIEIEAEIACRVESGPTEVIHVRASADTICYSIDKKHIDFRRQLSGDVCRTTLTIVNQGVVGFTFETYVAPVLVRDRVKQTEQFSDTARLRVEPRRGVVSPMSAISLDIIYSVGMPGPINEHFDLEIAQRAPVCIHVGGWGSLPQVYLNIPRFEAIKRVPVEICYRAVSSLTARFLAEVRRVAVNIERIIPTVNDNTPGYIRIPKCERERLTANGWEVISRDVTLPTAMDIEMAVERLLSIEHMNYENRYIRAEFHNSAMKKRGISSFLVPEYIIVGGAVGAMGFISKPTKRLTASYTPGSTRVGKTAHADYIWFSDMGYVVIGSVGYYSTMLINYGPTPVDIRIRRSKKECSALKEAGIVVQFHDRRDLPVGESTSLNVMFHPAQSVYTEKRSDVEHTIYLEVTRETTMPISVRAIATYPFLTAHTADLAFKEVAIGTCMLMPILLRNDGWVPCEWQATIRCEGSSRSSKQETGPFFLHYSADTFLPGCENVINIYFKPKEAKYSTGQLRIKIDQSIFPVLVSMSGTGIAPGLHVSEDSLRFDTTLPYVQPQQKTFVVKNIGSYPVEVFWRNFDKNITDEERIIRILSHYYGVDEILFPPRCPGDKLSPRIYDFYQTLCEEVTAVLDTRKSTSRRSSEKPAMETRNMKWEGEEKSGGAERPRVGEKDVDIKDRDETVYNETDTTPHQTSEKTEISLSEQPSEPIGQASGHSSLFYEKIIGGFPEPSVQDPEQTEAILHRYIDELHEREDFLEIMKDPVKGVFEDAEIELPLTDHSLPLTRPCIIFHGAPFTACQQAACQVGKMLGASVLSINTAVTEIIALGSSACSNKLREIVDENYYELLSRSEAYRKKLSLDALQSNLGDVNPYTPIDSGKKSENSNASGHRTPGTVGENDAEEVHVIIPEFPVVHNERVAANGDKSIKALLKLPAEPDPLEEFNRIPQPDEIKSMNPLDEYEYKIRAVLLLQKIMSSAKIVEETIPRKPQRDAANDKTSGRIGSSGTKKSYTEGTFLGISLDLIYEALKQRLAMKDFQAGFTVQSLDNFFVKDERDTLVMLLSIVGNSRYLLFLTFHNTFNMYLTQNEKLVAAGEMKAAAELENKLASIEQMTRAEYDHISEDEKMLYAANTLPDKRADSRRRRLIHNQKLTEAISNRKTLPSTKRVSVAALMCESKASKSKTTRTETMKSLVESSNESQLTKAKQSTSTSNRQTTGAIGVEDKIKRTCRPLNELEEISRLMDIYRTSLVTLQPVLANWNPQNSTYIEPATKNKTPLKSARSCDTIQQTDESRGIEVWYVAPMDPWNNVIYEKVASYLADMDDIKPIPSLEDHSKISLAPKLYSVAGKEPINRGSSAVQSGVYTLTSVVEVSAAESDSPVDRERTIRAVGDVARDVEPDDSMSIATGTVVEEPLRARWIIRPNELCKFNVHFIPKSVGIYKDVYDLGVVGSNVTHRIEITGTADIPKLSMSPNIIFSKVEESKLDDLNMPAYFLDTKTYDFGSMPLTISDGKRLGQTRETKFIFLNTSNISATISFFLMDNSDVCSIAPDLLNIAPGKSGSLNVWAGVSRIGPNTERLLLCITNNPQVEIIQLRSSGSKLEVELEGKIVAFEKTLLWRKAKRTIIVKNKSSVPLHWRLNLTENGIGTQVTLHPEQGLVQPLANSDIECIYSAKLVGMLEKKIIAFEAYLGEYDTEPVVEDFITVTGETYDVKVDLANASPIDLKRVKVGTLATETFTINNRGPHDVGFIIQPGTPGSSGELKSNFPSTVNEDFELEPASGSLLPEKPMVIIVNFLPRSEMTILEAPLFRCSLIDAHKSPTAVAEFPLLVSASAHYAKVKIRPSLGLNFGPMAIYEKKTIYLDIINVGYFSFQYKFSCQEISDSSTDALSILDKSHVKDRTEKTVKPETLTSRMGTVPRSKKENKTSRTTKGMRSGGDEKIPVMRVGPFVLSKDEGEVQAGETESIAVQCCPDSPAIYEKEIQVFLSNIGPNEKNTEPIRLSAKGCIPIIDLQDLDAIFRENLIVDSVNDFRCPRDIGPHVIYGRQEKCLYFRRVGLLTTHTARFKLHNPGFVPSDVTVKLDSETDDPVHGDGRAGGFEIEPQNAKIPPMSTGIFTVSFSPKLLGSYAAVFNIVLELSSPLESPWVTIKVCGEGAIPEVALLEPTVPYTNDQILLNFGRTLVDEADYRLLRLKNVGVLEAKVIVVINGDGCSLFTFESADQDIEGSVSTWRRECVKDKRRLVCCLMPEEIGCINVKFAPNEVGKYEGQIEIFTVGNPYERIAVVITGESFIEDVILEGLELTVTAYATPSIAKRSSRSRKGSRDSQLKSPFPTSAEFITPIMSYKLDYGNCSLNESKWICFRITNKSKEHLFRFEWCSHPNVVFSPSVGYLNVHGSKDIIANFSAPVSMVHTETQLECTINEITLQLPAAGEPNAICWDDRQTNIRWDVGESNFSSELIEHVGSRSQIFTKVIEPIPEPVGCHLVPGSTKTIRVILCATAGYSQYDCSIKEINFKDVLIFQSCKHTFVLSNPGVVDMAYRWSVYTDEQQPMRLGNPASREVLRSLDNPRYRPTSRPGSRKLSGILYPTDHDNPESSIIVLSKTDDARDFQLRQCHAESASDALSSVPTSSRSRADSSAERDYLPFEVIPEAGILLPGESIECTVVFSPLDVFVYQECLTCRIQNLDPALPPLNVTVTARSLVPYCHFNIPDSDYLSGGKRDTAALGLLGIEIDGPPVNDVKVVEIQAVGVGQTLIKKFRMTNPTMEDYNFSWREWKTRCVEEICYFDCLVTEGVAERGKQTEFVFTFLAKDVGVFESLWIFSIQRYKVETTFLFVATVTEPLVYLNPGYLRIEPAIIDATARASLTIINSENIQLSFCVMPKSLYSDDRVQRLIVEPMSGTLQSNSEQLLKIEFQPAFPGEMEFSVHCFVAKLKNPLVAIVSTITYSIEPRVVYRKSDGQEQQIRHDEDNTVDCGNMKLNQPITLNIHITNIGESTFQYTWDLSCTGEGVIGNEVMEEGCKDEPIGLGGFAMNLRRKQGRVTSKSSVTCPLTITARRSLAVLNHRVTLKIHRNREYFVFLKGVVQDSSYVLNFKTYDFGPSYIQPGNACHYSTKIHFTNNEETPCTLSCKIRSLPHLLVEPDHITAVPGLSSVSISIKFIPLERVCYRETITLLINSTLEKKVTIIGEGIEYKVCLVDPRDKFIDLGNLAVGESVIRKVPLINKGRAPIILRIGLVSELPAYKKIRSKLECCEFYHDRDCGHETGPSTPLAKFSDRAQIPSMQEVDPPLQVALTIEPSEPVTLHPNREFYIFVNYSPVRRTKTFEEKIGCQMHETLLPMFIVRSACIGAEFVLDKTFLLFGTVVQGCSRNMKIILTNTGDIGGGFTWDVGQLMPHYNLLPRTGYCSPGMEAHFNVTFSPKCRSNSIQGQARIDIENYQTISLTTSGACDWLPEPIDTLQLSTRVRQTTSADITVMNTASNETWTIEPVISGDYFTATERFAVPPLKSSICTVTYKPLIMTTTDQPHRGTIFFKLPEGRVLLYSLVGTSLSPEPVANIFREFPARTRYTELLPVSNWLKKTQRFLCVVELLDDKKVSPIYNFLGNKTIDVPSEEQRDYRAVFHSYREGSFRFRITFKNEEGEYHYYGLDYRVTKPGIAGKIKLTAIVRTVACHLLKLENPLSSQPVTYIIESPHPSLDVSEFSKLVNPESTENVKIEFKPLVVPFETIVKLDAVCAELGTFSYTLSLKAAPASPEKLVCVSAMLGSSVNLPITIKNFGKQTANFSIAIDDSSFSCGRNISIDGFGQATIGVTYEPCELTNASATLTATSQIAGEYIFPLIGTAIPPKPQGPFTVTPDRAALVPFKNIFGGTKTFEFCVVPPDTFYTECPSQTIQSKKTVRITVGLVSQRSPQHGRDIEAPIAGRLIVCPTEAALSRIKWIYYLRGVFE